jgi:LCP family protein required for cell wall assembly
MIGRTKDPERPPRVAFGLYKRALIGCLIIIAATAAAGSSAALLTVGRIVTILKNGQKGHQVTFSRDTLTEAQAGDPQTLLVLGSDRRFHDPKATKGFTAPQEARSDTIMLIHMDPHAAATTVLSIPRDLEVTIPGHGIDKINAAYSIGGPDLVARTVEKLLGPTVKINHVINVNFNGFQRAVNYLHGVYVDVDQFYYHSNAGLPPSLQYSAIDVKPGYQKLVGSDALAYVRFRHTDSDFIRADRQQDFLREVKDQFGESALIDRLVPLVKIFARYTQTDSDLESFHGIYRLLELMAYSTKHPVQQVRFPNGDDVTSTLGGTPAEFVTVDDAAVPSVVSHFLHPLRLAALPGSTSPSTSSGTKVTVHTHKSKHKKKTTKTKTKKKKKKHSDATTTPSTLAPGLIASKALMENAMAPVIAHQQIPPSLPIYVPAAMVAGTHLVTYTAPKLENPYPYTIYDRNADAAHPKGLPHSAYVIVVAANTLQGGYYDIQGTNWMDPPIIDNPTQTIIRRGRRLMLFTSGGKDRFVAWKTPHGVYWVSNTLDYELSNQEMVGIARSLTRFGS